MVISLKNSPLSCPTVVPPGGIHSFQRFPSSSALSGLEGGGWRIIWNNLKYETPRHEGFQVIGKKGIVEFSGLIVQDLRFGGVVCATRFCLRDSFKVDE
jgi:hypothetical protein